MRYQFVKSVMEQLLHEDIIQPQDSILAVCAGKPEVDLFSDLQFDNVTISNLDERMSSDEFAPFKWSYQDVQNLNCQDASFEFVFESDGLHHCASPHRALLEMYRVARKGIIVFESRDSVLMRLANRLKFSPNYELSAVVTNNFTYGGVNNTHVPNYIYRWTEREFEKTILSYNPTGKHGFRFFYRMSLPCRRMSINRNKFIFDFCRILEPLAKLGTLLFKKQSNSFAMVALKPNVPDDLWPWLEIRSGKVGFKRDYVKLSE